MKYNERDKKSSPNTITSYKYCGDGERGRYERRRVTIWKAIRVCKFYIKSDVNVWIKNKSNCNACQKVLTQGHVCTARIT